MVIITKQNVSIKLEPVKMTVKETQKIKKRDVKRHPSKLKPPSLLGEARRGEWNMFI